jgi:hydrogenase/urease accessory protein HupE
MNRRSFWSALGCLWALLIVLAIPRVVQAHAVGLSRGEYLRTADGLALKLTFAREELRAFAPESDGGSASQRAAAGEVMRRVQVTAAGARCRAVSGSASAVERDGILIALEFSCARADTVLEVELLLLDELPHGHRHSARIVSGDHAVSELYSRERASFRVPALEDSAARASSAPSGSLIDFAWLGFEHLVTGYDHLVFLLALLMVSSRFGGLLKAVSAFTLAHSVTLGVSVAGVWTPAPHLVEPLIALSVAYVGVENFFVKNGDQRWRITLPFGLVHGFGFSGALAEIGLSGGELVAALASFNLGIELGQVLVLALALPLVRALARRDWFVRRAVPVLSAAIVLVGVGWFAERVRQPAALWVAP